jgi:hypothetical protein
MGRTKETIAAELEDLAPSWFRNPVGRALLGGLAQLLATMESVADEWQVELHSGKASGGMLDSHGLDAGVERDPWEDDETYRSRAVSEPRGPTPAFLETEANRVAFPYLEGHRIELQEPKLAVADVDVFSDITPVFPFGHAPVRLPVFTELPLAEVPAATGSFADLSFADFDHATPSIHSLERDEFARPINAIERFRPAGVGYIAEVLDSAQLAHLSALGTFDVSYYV